MDVQRTLDCVLGSATAHGSERGSPGPRSASGRHLPLRRPSAAGRLPRVCPHVPAACSVGVSASTPSLPAWTAERLGCGPPHIGVGTQWNAGRRGRISTESSMEMLRPGQPEELGRPSRGQRLRWARAGLCLSSWPRPVSGLLGAPWDLRPHHTANLTCWLTRAPQNTILRTPTVHNRAQSRGISSW